MTHLPDLTRHSNWNVRTTTQSEDDVVIVVDKGLPRNRWTRGRIVAVYPGRDGVVHIVTVLTSSSVYWLVVAKLFEINVQEQEIPFSYLLEGSMFVWVKQNYIKKSRNDYLKNQD